MSRTFLLLAMLSCWLPRAWSGPAGDYVTARLEQMAISVGEEALLRVDVCGDGASDAELAEFPALAGLEFRLLSGPDFSVRSPSTATGGEPQGDQYIASYAVGIRGLEPGEYLVRGIGVVCQSDQQIPANPVFLTVTGAGAGGGPVRLVIEPARQEAYAHQPFRVRVRLELDARISRLLTASTARFVFPWWERIVPVAEEGVLERNQRRFEITGAHRSLRLDQKERTVEKDGVFYEVLTGDLAVLAPEPGVLDFRGSLFRCEIPPADAATPPMFGAGGEIHEELAAERSMTIIPLPETGRPAGFVDAVGDFTIAVETDRTSVTVGEQPVRVTLTIREQERYCSNIAVATFPGLDRADGFRTFDRETLREPGARIYRLDLLPETAAVAAVPPFTIRWFDPRDGAYRSASSEPVPLVVRPHPTGRELVEPAAARAGGWPRWLLPAGLLAGLLVLVAVAAAWFVPRARRRPGASHGLPAYAQLTRGLAELAAADERDDLDEARLLARYLAARLGAEPGRCFGAGAVEMLGARGVDGAVCCEIREFFETAERRAFSGTDRGAGPVAGAAELARRLEEELG